MNTNSILTDLRGSSSRRERILSSIVATSDHLPIQFHNSETAGTFTCASFSLSCEFSSFVLSFAYERKTLIVPFTSLKRIRVSIGLFCVRRYARVDNLPSSKRARRARVRKNSHVLRLTMTPLRRRSAFQIRLLPLVEDYHACVHRTSDRVHHRVDTRSVD